jgi:hypothetical protein
VRVLLRIISALVGAGALVAFVAVLWMTWRQAQFLRQIGPGLSTAEVTRAIASATAPFLIKAFAAVQLWRLKRIGLVVTFGVCAASLVSLCASAALGLMPIPTALMNGVEPLIIGIILLLPAASHACLRVKMAGEGSSEQRGAAEQADAADEAQGGTRTAT